MEVDKNLFSKETKTISSLDLDPNKLLQSYGITSKMGSLDAVPANENAESQKESEDNHEQPGKLDDNGESAKEPEGNKFKFSFNAVPTTETPEEPKESEESVKESEKIEETVEKPTDIPNIKQEQAEDIHQTKGNVSPINSFSSMATPTTPGFYSINLGDNSPKITNTQPKRLEDGQETSSSAKESPFFQYCTTFPTFASTASVPVAPANSAQPITPIFPQTTPKSNLFLLPTSTPPINLPNPSITQTPENPTIHPIIPPINQPKTPIVPSSSSNITNNPSFTPQGISSSNPFISTAPNINVPQTLSASFPTIPGPLFAPIMLLQPLQNTANGQQPPIGGYQQPVASVFNQILENTAHDDHIDLFFRGICQQVKNANLAPDAFMDLQSTILGIFSSELSKK